MTSPTSLPRDSNADADGWIDWHGGECPVEAETLVQVTYRDGSGRDWIAMPAGGWSANDPNNDAWVGTSKGADPHHADIIAYRIVEAA